MRIGLTYDLAADWEADGLSGQDLAEFDAPGTIEAIAAVFTARGCTVERIGRARALLARLLAGERWDLVFNICEGRRGLARESLVPALLEEWGIPCALSDAATLAAAHRKDFAKRIVRDQGVPTAEFAVLTRADAAITLPFPVFAKPVAEGTGKGISGASLCQDAVALGEVAAGLLARFGQPVLAEAWLPGREFTIGVVGAGEPVAVMEVTMTASAESAAYGWLNKKDYRGRMRYRLADDAEARTARDVAVAAWRALGCRDGGRVDVRSDAQGRPQFLEVNPLAGLHPVDSDLVILAGLAGWSYDRLLATIIGHACARNGLPWHAA